MKKAIAAFLLVAIIAVSLVGAYYWWNTNSTPPSTSSETKTILIKKGTSADAIAQILYEEGIIKSPLAFKVYVQFTGKSQSVQAGEYDLPLDQNIQVVTARLLSGPSEIWVTIPEGYRREQIAHRFANSFGLVGENFNAFVTDFMTASEGEEGFLFPDTYLFPKTASAEKVVSMMSDTFGKKITPDIQAGIESSPYTQNQLITMASILERETKTDAERPMVAGILWKRLENEWPLQVDASVQYGVASFSCVPTNVNCEWWPILTINDIEAPSVYNSYKNPELPPSPIASPGLLSIEAAIFPEESEYWFYIHAPDGTIYYAETVEGHNANIVKYLGK